MNYKIMLKKILVGICLVMLTFNNLEAGIFKDLINLFEKIQNPFLRKTNYFNLIEANDLESFERYIINKKINLDSPLNEQGQTPLIIATRLNRPAMMELFIKYGCNLDQTDIKGLASTWYAVADHREKEALPLVDILVKAGADCGISSESIAYNTSPFLLSLRIRSLLVAKEMQDKQPLSEKSKIIISDLGMRSYLEFIERRKKINRSESIGSIFLEGFKSDLEATSEGLDLALANKNHRLTAMIEGMTNSNSSISLVDSSSSNRSSTDSFVDVELE